jgi:hypothetical protein
MREHDERKPSEREAIHGVQEALVYRALDMGER